MRRTAGSTRVSRLYVLMTMVKPNLECKVSSGFRVWGYLHFLDYKLFFAWRVTRGGRGEVSPVHFWKLEKSAQIWRKITLIVVIYGYNFSFKMKFLRVSKGKHVDFFPAWPFFLVLLVNVYQSAITRRKLPCPKKFLVTRLYTYRR